MNLLQKIKAHKDRTQATTAQGDEPAQAQGKSQVRDIDPATVKDPDQRKMLEALQQKVGSLESELQTSRAHFHKAGSIDNETIRKAALYDEEQKRRASKDQSLDVDESLRPLMDKLDEPAKKLMKFLGAQGALENPAVRKVAERIEALEKQVEAANARTEAARSASLESEYAELTQFIPADKLREMVTPSVQAKLNRLISDGSADGLIDAMSMVFKRDFKTEMAEKRSPKKDRQKPPPESSREVPDAMVQAKPPQRFKNLKEAYAWKQKNDPSFTGGPFWGGGKKLA